MTIATTEATITKHEAAQVERANASKATPLSSFTGSGCCLRAGTAGSRCSRRPAT
jgi:hypothetical protein